MVYTLVYNAIPELKHESHFSGVQNLSMLIVHVGDMNYNQVHVK
jgi:hypothetical protein